MAGPTYAELITAFSTFATAVVVVWQARDSRSRLQIDVKPLYRPSIEVEAYNISNARITVRQLSFVFRKRYKFFPYKNLKPREFESFSIDGGHRDSQVYSLTMPINLDKPKDYDWNDVRYVEITLSNGKKFKGSISKLMRQVFAANEDYFQGTKWSSYGVEDYGNFMKKKIGTFD